MTKSTLATAVLIGCAALAVPTVSPAAQVLSAADSAVRIERWSEDLRVLATELERRHVDDFARKPKREFLAALDSVRRVIPHRDDTDLTLAVVRLVASLGDSHSTFSADFAALGFHRLPIAPFWFDDGVFIRDADSTLTDLIGAQILAVGAIPADSLLARLTLFIAADNSEGLRHAAPSTFVIAEALQAVGATSARERVSLRVRLRSGDVRTIHVPSRPWREPVAWSLGRLVPLDSAPLYRRHTNRAYWFEVLPADSTLYIAYNRATDDPADPIEPFAERVGRAAREPGIRRVVVDFRLNSGGNSGYFRFIERELVAARDARRDLVLVGIIGRRTFSSGLWNALGFRRNTAATLYGEATSGKPNHFGEVRQFRLPNSALAINYSTRRWRLLPDEDPPTLAPDIAVPVLASDYFALRDAVLQRILGAPR